MKQTFLKTNELDAANLWSASSTILDDRINKKYIAELNNEGNNDIESEKKSVCKIICFLSEWKLDNVLTTIANIKIEEYPNLFTFIINAEDINFGIRNEAKEEENKINKQKTEKLINALLKKFGQSRPLFLQLSSQNENVTKFFYKEQIATKFCTIDQKQNKFEEIKNFPTLLCSFLGEKCEDFEAEMIKLLPQVQKCSLIFLNFITIFDLSENFLELMILEVSRTGTVADFLAAINAPFDGDKGKFNSESQSYFYIRFAEDQVSDDEDDSEGNSLENSSLETSSVSSNNDFSTSILHTAIESKNGMIVSYLITNWSDLIQLLPFEHQVRISTTAFNTNQHDVLCDLVDIADFPFPKNFETVNGTVSHERLREIIAKRTELNIAVKLKKIDEISKFAENNLKLKRAFNTENDSLIKQVADSKNFKLYFHLKAMGFQAVEFVSLEEILSNEDMKDAKRYVRNQRNKNVNGALIDDQNSVSLLCTKSSIHNNKNIMEKGKTYFKTIMMWYSDINEIAPEMLNVAASCGDLKIIYDFTSESSDNASAEESDAAGVTFPISKLIFVGAKFSDKKREQHIKGVIAHELCHYAMRLVYENQENPYYKHDIDVAENFERIVKTIDKWSQLKTREPNDECNGIISSIFLQYSTDEFHLELIVRVVQILVEYSYNEGIRKHLQEKYDLLFDFWNSHVVPELQRINTQKVCKSRSDVRILNKSFELLEQIKNEEINLSASEYSMDFIHDDLDIIETNVPKLMLISIYNHLHSRCWALLDAQALFIDPQKLKNQETINKFSKLLTQNSKLDVFVDFSKGFFENIEIILKIKSYESINLTSIVSNEKQSRELEQHFEKLKQVPKKREINFSWKNLEEESQKLLLQSKINFQNDQQVSLMDLLVKRLDLEGMTTEDKFLEIRESASKIINDQLLQLLVEKSPISISTKLQSEQFEENFNLLFHPQKFKRKTKENKEEGRMNKIAIPELSQEEIERLEEASKITQDNLLKEVKDEKYVLISDIAGSGKTWVMKNFTNILREQNPIKWVTYVDLKQFIAEIKAEKVEPEFSMFMAKKVLKLEFEFEEEIFAKLYQNGKVLILFDGFDEIAPDCAVFVTKLALSFEFNGGNQLWIATRDHFEVGLQETLEHAYELLVYKLVDFKKEDGINLIVENWMIKDEECKKMKSRNDFLESIKNGPKFEEYIRRAHEIVEKIDISKNSSVGIPQLFKMIANGFENNDVSISDMKRSQIYAVFVKNIYKRWSYEKGAIRQQACIESLQYEHNFWQFHQYSAIVALFSEFVDELFRSYDGSEWPEEEIIACGLMSKKSGKFYFLHETICEFFIAHFISKELKKPKICEKVLEMFVVVLTNSQYGPIQMFLNDLLMNGPTFEKIFPYIENFYKMDSFSDLFTKNLANMADLVISILKNEKGNYDKVKEIFNRSIRIISSNTKNKEIFFKFQDFLLKFLKVDDLKDLVIEHEVLLCIINSSLDIEIFEKFVTDVEAKTDREFIANALKLTEDMYVSRDIFRSLCLPTNLDANKVQKCMQIIQNYFLDTELFDLMKKCKFFESNFVEVFILTKNEKGLKILWIEIEKLYKAQNLFGEFKEIIRRHYSNYKRTILHYAAECDKFELHKVLWELLLNTFESKDELRDFILQKNIYDETFIYCLLKNTKYANIVKFTFTTLEKEIDDTQLRSILIPRSRYKMNLLQYAARHTTIINVHSSLWSLLQKLFDANEFLEIFKEKDDDERTTLDIIAWYSTAEVFKFTVSQWKKIEDGNEIRKMFSNLTKSGENLLQSTASRNVSLELHQSLWEFLSNNFTTDEIIKFIENVDENGDDLLNIAALKNKEEIVKLTWEKMAAFMSKEKQIEYLSNNDKNLIKSSLQNSNNLGVQKLIENIIRNKNMP